MDRTKFIIELSKLMVKMSERNATEQELLNVVEFFKAAVKTTMECDNIYEFEILNNYRKKYFK